MKYICEHCRNQVTDSQYFCHECGSQLELVGDKVNVNETTKRAANSNIANKVRELSKEDVFNNIKNITISESIPSDTMWDNADVYHRQNQSVDQFFKMLDGKGYTHIFYKTATLSGSHKVLAIKK